LAACSSAFEPGWRWSQSVTSAAGTDRHVSVVHSGRGATAGVAGDERFVGFEFESRAAKEYAKG
jgi:hypothetical protein